MTTYYVATTGDDGRSPATAANSGTPWATLQHALVAIPAEGDVIELLAGTWVDSATATLNSVKSCTVQNAAGATVVYGFNQVGRGLYLQNPQPAELGVGGVRFRKNPAGGTLTFRHSGTVTVSQDISNKNKQLFYIELASGSTNTYGLAADSEPCVYFDGVELGPSRGINIHAVNCSIDVRNCDIHHGAVGVQLRGNAGYPAAQSKVLTNDIHDMDKLWQTHRLAEGADSGAQGITLDLTDGVEVAYNRVWNNWSASDDYVYDGGAFEIYRAGNWVIHDNEAWDNNGTLETGTDASHQTQGGGRFYNNYIHGFVCKVAPAAGDCIMIRSCPNSWYYNNTFVMGGAGAAGNEVGVWLFDFKHLSGGFGGPLSGVEVRNNIFVMLVAHKGGYFTNVIGVAAGFVWDYNLMYYAGSASEGMMDGWAQNNVAGFRTASGFGAHDIWGVNPQLQAGGLIVAGSPAIDAGYQIPGRGFSGAGVDIGFHEVPPVLPPEYFTYVRDTFTRTVADSLGSAEVGGAYSTSGAPAANFDVDGSKATFSNPSAAAGLNARLDTATPARDVVFRFSVSVGAIPSTGDESVRLAVRRTNGSNDQYRAILSFLANGQLTITFARRTAAGGQVTIAGPVTPYTATYAANDVICVKGECIGSNPTLFRMQAWKSTVPEPGTWAIDTSDSTAAQQVAGTYAVESYLASGVTNLPLVYTLDDFTVTSPRFATEHRRKHIELLI